MTEPVTTTIEGGVATVTLTRPEVHNAFDDNLIGLLTNEFRRLGQDESVRVVVLASTGPSFSAGADLNWMRRMAGYSDEENLRDAMALALMLDTIDRCPKPVLAVVQGAALGGGVGLVACCDIAVAADTAVFGLTEVRLGIIPSVISPYVLAAIGARASRRYMLTGERFDAAEARRIGLVSEVVPQDKLAESRDRMIRALLTCGPKAQAAAKDLVHVVRDSESGPDLMRFTARRIADIRASAEGKEGLSAFLDKRKPAWTQG
ncbi:MAG: enoyl-CoA hydratase/isomerase family protein [Rhodospirillales bacterium]|nr:enoyl-CoA hydratase/isomerase family protein [Rhodospirillales bacterium]